MRGAPRFAVTYVTYEGSRARTSSARAAMWVKMPEWSAPRRALALVLAEQTPMILGHRFRSSMGIWMAKSWSD